MYQNPTLLPAISNRETLLQVIQIADGDTGDLISLTDTNNVPVYDLELEITEAGPNWMTPDYGISPVYFPTGRSPSITASLANYISIIDVGTFQVQIPKSIIRTLRPLTYDVFLTISPLGVDDSRQIMIGRLPVLYGGRNT
jgi:hypothetical protein